MTLECAAKMKNVVRCSLPTIPDLCRFNNRAVRQNAEHDPATVKNTMSKSLPLNHVSKSIKGMAKEYEIFSKRKSSCTMSILKMPMYAPIEKKKIEKIENPVIAGHVSVMYKKNSSMTPKKCSLRRYKYNNGDSKTMTIKSRTNHNG